MRMYRSEPLIYDPEPELILYRSRAQQRLAQVVTMANNNLNGNNLDPEMEARIEARVQERLAARMQEQEQMNARRSLRDLTSTTMSCDYPGSIAYPNMEGANFELRPNFIQMVSQHQFGGSSLEDPHVHLERFIRNCNTHQSTTVPMDTTKLKLVPFSVRDAAEERVNSKPQR